MTDLLACSVCWGAAQEPVVHGTKLSIVFLLGLTYLLLGGGAGMVFVLRRRARALTPRRAGTGPAPAPTPEHPAATAAPSPPGSRD